MVVQETVEKPSEQSRVIRKYWGNQSRNVASTKVIYKDRTLNEDAPS